MLPNNIAVVDTETTGMEPGDQVIEFAAYYSTDYAYIDSLYGTTKKIPAEVSAVHHLRNEDVAGLPLFSEVAPLLRDNLHRQGVRVLAAHNAEFDRKMLGEEFADFEWICTLKVAMHLYPDMPSYKNEALCYALGLGKLGRADRNTGQAHSALFDAMQTGALLDHFLTMTSVEQMIQWTKDVKNITRLQFGKHKGKTWDQVDSGYLIWIKGNMDDPDMVELAKREMDRRGFGKKK